MALTSPNRVTPGTLLGTREYGKTLRRGTSGTALSASDGPSPRYIAQLAANQALIGYSIWTGGVGADVLSRDANFLEALGLGVVGSLPLLFLSQKIERSESPLVGTLNLSTEITMLRIFGSEPRPTLALAVSLFLACLTGLVEEVTFRGEALPVLAQWSVDHLGVGNGIPWGTALSTLLFAALHVNPKGLFGGRDAAVDALVLFALQICTGGPSRCCSSSRTTWRCPSSPTRYTISTPFTRPTWRSPPRWSTPPPSVLAGKW